MAKRRLSRQQLSRIRARQQQRRARVATEEGSSEGTLGPPRPGLVIAHYGAQLDIEPLDGSEEPVMRCYQRAHLGEVVVGDRVVWRGGDTQGVIEAVEPRRSLLMRPGFGGQLKPVAANIDLIVLVIAPEPEPFANLIDRYLVAAEHTGIDILLLLNKHDLLDGHDAAETLTALLESYRSIGYPVLAASSQQKHGLDALRNALQDRTAVFVGQSGVGKSSLINALIPGLEAAVGALSTAAAKGRHTTTTARLYHAPFGTDIIDSPGIREFSLEHLDADSIAAGFREFRPWLGQCEFRDCRHRDEPRCALHDAVARGDISPDRLQSFASIIADLRADSRHVPAS